VLVTAGKAEVGLWSRPKGRNVAAAHRDPGRPTDENHDLVTQYVSACAAPRQACRVWEAAPPDVRCRMQ
jgi:hypothetical protein